MSPNTNISYIWLIYWFIDYCLTSSISVIYIQDENRFNKNYMWISEGLAQPCRDDKMYYAMAWVSLSYPIVIFTDFLMDWTISSSTMYIYYILLKQYFTFLAYHWLLLSFIRDMPLIPFFCAVLTCHLFCRGFMFYLYYFYLFTLTGV
jgi:hypothetical protein